MRKYNEKANVEGDRLGKDRLDATIVDDFSSGFSYKRLE